MAGYVGVNDDALLKNMIAVLRHRGPDDTGIYLDDGIGLANARLSIIDIQGGHQPQHNDDGTVHVTYNGEIYNFESFREELEKLGHKFVTRSDTEVIVHGYEQYGEDFVQRLNGMFAIALWDSREAKLLLARDRMGIKPLYYTIQGQQLLFASELKALLQSTIERVVDQQALYEILNLGYIPGNRTLIQNIHKLPPSCILLFKNARAKVSTYWEMPTQLDADQGRLIPALKTALQRSVEDQLVADVPVGCFLSGGLDTATITAFASKALTQPLKTFCMGFGEESDELRDARTIAEHFGTDHHELTIDSSQGMKLYPKMIWHMEAPKYNLYPWFVCELVRKYVTVCLSGNGGDEIFGGYIARYQKALRISSLSHNTFSPILRAAGHLVPSLNDLRTENKLRVLRFLGDDVREYLVLAGVLPDAINRHLFLENNYSNHTLIEQYAPFFSNKSSFLDNLLRTELRTKLVDDLLSVDDSMSMAHSLELRVPMLDNRIVDLMVTAPWQDKFLPCVCGKLALRKAMKDILPEESLRKPKWGFSVDVSSWYKGELGELVRQIVPTSNIIKRYFSKKAVGRLIDRPSTSENRRYQVLQWQMLGFHFWHKIFIDSDHPEKVRLEIDALVP
ncbi:MAG: asparagine synthase (glutamine-hydrolyzing) [Candidatus Bathyarchaeia archaeon]